MSSKFFRRAVAYHPRIKDGLRCPVCGGIDWVSGGVAVVEDRDGSLRVESLEAVRVRPVADWSCLRCGEKADPSGRPSRLLARVLIAGRLGELR